MVLEICIAGRFLADFFYCYSQQIVSAVANESLIPHNLIQRTPETQNLATLNVTPSQIKKNKRYRSVFRTKDFVPQKNKQQKYLIPTDIF